MNPDPAALVVPLRLYCARFGCETLSTALALRALARTASTDSGL